MCIRDRFGSNVIEQGSGTIFPGEVLALVHEYTGNEKDRSALCKAADFIMEHYVEDVLYLGGLNDTTHKKSVKIDAVGVMYNMRTLLLAYETTKKERYLYGAKSAAQILEMCIRDSSNGNIKPCGNLDSNAFS